MPKYPECEKFYKIKDMSLMIGDFLAWLGSEKHVHLAHCEERRGYLSYYPYSTESLLAEFFNIDLDKLEKEKQEMLRELRGSK